MSPFLPSLVAPLLVPFLALSGQPSQPAPLSQPGQLGETAGSLQVSPERVAIPAGVKVRIVTVTNDGERPVHLQVLPQAWHQTPRGDAQLSATDALVSVPSALTLGPGESRQVTILPTRASGAIEQAFRVAIDEVDADGYSLGADPWSVPVFIEPRVARAAPIIDRSLLSYRTFSFSLANEGSAHFVATKVELVATNEAGKRVFAAELPASYVLAGGSRAHVVDLPDAACRAANVEVQVETGRERFVFPFGRLRCST